MAYYRMTIGECVTQVYEVDAKSWEEAKKVAFDDLREGDVLAECPPGDVKQNKDFPEYSYLDEDLCTEYTTLMKGTWANTPKGREYWESRVWFYDDEPETYLTAAGELFTDWEKDED